MNSGTSKLSVILPARNEVDSLRKLLSELVKHCGKAEVIVVNDESEDETEELLFKYDIKVISNPCPKGNGTAIKIGSRNATGDILFLTTPAIIFLIGLISEQLTVLLYLKVTRTD